MPLLVDRTGKESAVAIGGSWLAFVLAICLALPQPPNSVQAAIGSAVGAFLILVGFAAVTRSRTIPRHGVKQCAKLAALAAGAGAAMGLALLGAMLFLARLEPALRARFAGRVSEPAWRPWALGFESSILEESTFRLFAMSVIAWLAARLLRNSRAAWLIALAVSALLFGLVHLPAWFALTHPTLGLVGSVLVLNGASGLLLGWIFWRWGLPYAIVCHLFGDVVVQALGPRLLS